MIREMLIITLMTVWVIDLTDFVDNVKKGIWKLVFGKTKPYKDFSMKPFDCSLCASWWLLILYILLSKVVLEVGLINAIGISAGFSFMTPVFKNALTLVRDIVNKVIISIYDLLKL